MDNILDGAGNDTGICSKLGNNMDFEKELCKILLRIYFWMDGFEQKHEAGMKNSTGYFQWKEREKKENETEEEWKLQLYYRCLLGRITMMSMLGTHCSMEKVLPIVEGGVVDWRKSHGRSPGSGNELCKGVDLQSLKLGKGLIWEKYFAFLGKRRKRYRRAYQVRGLTLQEQIMYHVDQDGTHGYTLVKERKPRSMPIKRRKKRGVRHRPGRRGGVRRRMIIDIHLEVLNECQRENLHSTKEDFFEILVQEFMGREFMKEEKLPKEQIPSSDSGFREGRLSS
ncbi:SICA antigen [Plasmodium coatneyi]|uniref:SICA antigen n=1 Tax=Plasmodium coatneyi TaxID=208452 RepID=A0A1B1DV99_9APIC|nr:SICA antigen [Plasmodium coatneyi]ANQ06559.1 SICA antigen [Plasmodium coatneyi]